MVRLLFFNRLLQLKIIKRIWKLKSFALIIIYRLCILPVCIFKKKQKNPRLFWFSRVIRKIFTFICIFLFITYSKSKNSTRQSIRRVPIKKITFSEIPTYRDRSCTTKLTNTATNNNQSDQNKVEILRHPRLHVCEWSQ